MHPDVLLALEHMFLGLHAQFKLVYRASWCSREMLSRSACPSIKPIQFISGCFYTIFLPLPVSALHLTFPFLD